MTPDEVRALPVRSRLRLPHVAALVDKIRDDQHREQERRTSKGR